MPNPPGQQFCRLGSWSLLYGLSLPLIIALMPPEEVKRREKGIGEDEGDQARAIKACSNRAATRGNVLKHQENCH